MPDQWQVQVQAKIQSQARVVVYSDYLTADQLAAAHLGHTEDVTATVRDALAAAGPDARVCVLPEGPQTIPYVRGDRGGHLSCGSSVRPGGWDSVNERTPS